jgi:hypothetical protein
MARLLPDRCRAMDKQPPLGVRFMTRSVARLLGAIPPRTSTPQLCSHKSTHMVLSRACCHTPCHFARRTNAVRCFDYRCGWSCPHARHCATARV